jgi:Uma2 family endonuclease
MATLSTITTAAELAAMPADGRCYELLRGELRMMSPAGSLHGKIAARLLASLLQHVEAGDLGTVYAAETGFQIGSNPDTVRAPDVAFVARQRLEAVDETTGYLPLAPDLAAEVVSPNDRYTEVEAKVRDWLAAGARLVLVVDPVTRTARSYQDAPQPEVLDATGSLDGGDVVPGWRMPLEALFR